MQYIRLFRMIKYWFRLLSTRNSILKEVCTVSFSLTETNVYNVDCLVFYLFAFVLFLCLVFVAVVFCSFLLLLDFVGFVLKYAYVITGWQFVGKSAFCK